MNRHPIQHLIILVVSLLFACCVLGVGLVTIGQTIQFRSRPSTTGTITRVDFGYDSNNRPEYAPEIDYVVDGETYHFKSEHTSANRHAWTKGDSIEVRYDPNNPADAEIPDTSADLIFPACATLFGGGLLFLVLFNAISQISEARKRRETAADSVPPYHYPQ